MRRQEGATMQKFRFHVVSLPHTQTTSEYNACAYTMKVIKFCKMMKSLGHEVYLYSSEDNEAPCDKHIQVVSKKEQSKWFGENQNKSQFFKVDYDPNKEYWQTMNRRAIKEIRKRAKKKDFICLIAGLCQKQIADGLPEFMNVEFGIGYTGVFSKYKIYESYAHMHYVSGTLHDDNGYSFDTVIPNYFDPQDFPYKDKKEDFYLFIGRMIERKGPAIAAEVTRQIGAKLVMVGQGVDKKVGNKIIAKEVTVEGDHIIHMGHADIKMRGELMSRAKAVFVFSTYLEPFGGTSIEPLFCGTPVITTDWGAFPENIPHGIAGYRSRTLGEAIWATKNLDKLDPKTIRKYAIDNFSMDRIKYLYQAYFEQLNTLWDKGWYSKWDNGVSKYKRYSKYI